MTESPTNKGGYIETCWAGEALGEECTNEAIYMLGWQPILKKDSPEYDPTVVSRLNLEGLIPFDWALSCDHHLFGFQNTMMAQHQPADYTADLVFIAKIQAVDYRTRVQVVPEHRELLDYMGEELSSTRTPSVKDGEPTDLDLTGEELTDDTPVIRPETEPESPAPWGYRADGVTPRKKPGRKAVASRQ